MARSQRATRLRLIRAAFQLFTTQGITETTTRQIAELAGVNEVTLFRQFGSKYGLLLAVIEDVALFTRLGESLGQQALQMSTLAEALRNYGELGLQTLEHYPELLRSLIGEAGHYPIENRRALGRGLTQANHYTAQYLNTVIQRQPIHPRLPIESLASLLNGLLLGYIVLKLTSEEDEVWPNRDNFLQDLVDLFLHGALVGSGAPDHRANSNEVVSKSNLTPKMVSDLPASLVHSILKRAQKAGARDYAIAYVLFGAGLSASEIAALKRSDSLSDAHQHVLQIAQGQVRQVPLNQWIWGKRYASHPHNPLNRWLKSRKDNQPSLFLNEANRPISEVEIRLQWQGWVNSLPNPAMEKPLAIEQAQQTWRVEMLMKGMSVENLSILTSQSLAELQPYIHRAREKTALEQAIYLDHKPNDLTKPAQT
jgi:AcrR family transcriptional regulator/site-specific recombinase XerD